MSVYKEKNLDELSSQELNDYQNLVNRTIAQLSIELKSSSPSRAKDAQDRLIHWEERLSNLVSFLGVVDQIGLKTNDAICDSP
ncbi:hypothetical protein ACED34_25370, partial [Vibrio splendidus]|uniref:hypothetical protein n=1 Tax=Vibrio splendidus TaxID=29497 RepID=UPI00352CDFBD